MGIVYDISKTPQEMADAAGVSLTEVRNFLQRSGHDYRTERANYLRKQVENFFEENPEAKLQTAADKLKMSEPTVRKYLNLAFKGEIPSKKRKPVLNKGVTGLSVNYTDSYILYDILKIYLPGKKTFDCDLTFGTGAFYSHGIAVPEHRYDKYMFGTKAPKRNQVKSLDKTAELPNECFMSVVIDLPLCIDNKDSGINAFKSLNAMYDTYHDMLSLASRLLRPGGILIFKTADFVLRNDEEARFCGQWATDHAIDFALELGFDLTDRFILAQRKSLQTSGSMKIRTGLKHGYFLIFTKI